MLQSKLHVFVARFIVPLASPRASFPLKIARVIYRSRGSEPQKTNASLFPEFQNLSLSKMRLSAKPFL